MDGLIKLSDYVSPKSDAMIRASVSRKLEELIYAYPKIPVAQLIAYVYRSKGEVQGSPWYWSDGRTLKKIEDIQRQLAAEYNRETGEFIDEPIELV